MPSRRQFIRTVAGLSTATVIAGCAGEKTTVTDVERGEEAPLAASQFFRDVTLRGSTLLVEIDPTLRMGDGETPVDIVIFETQDGNRQHAHPTRETSFIEFDEVDGAGLYRLIARGNSYSENGERVGELTLEVTDGEAVAISYEETIYRE